MAAAMIAAMGPVDFSHLHLLRPDWLWALGLLPVLAAVWLIRRRRPAEVWREAVDPHLLPHLLDGGDRPRHRRLRYLGLAAAALAYALAVLALAGPSWRQVEQPLWQGRQPLVVALELSAAMLAADPPPSRLAQARARLAALLASRDGPVGLLVFADDAFTVAPVTDDAANVALFLDALSPDIMPVDGRRADRAIASATRLMEQAGFERGRILLIAAEADARAVEAAADARAAGFEVAVLGLGRSGGVAYLDAGGRSAVAGFDEAALRRVATAGGGRYARLSPDDADLRALGVLEGAAADAVAPTAAGGRAWLDAGFWLVPAVMLLALLAFRRGAVFAALLLGLWLPMSPVQAADWWRRQDQVEHQRLDEAADAYRGGDYAAAAEGYSGVDSADGHYNRGNALAKAGRYQEAVEAYDRALQLQPGMEDAVANRDAVEAAMKRQPQSGDDGQPSGQSSGEDDGSPSSDGKSPQSGPADDARQPDAGDSQEQPASPRDGRGNPASGDRDGDGREPERKDEAADAPDARDARTQQSADEAQRRRMQQALEAGAGEDGKDGDGQDAQAQRARADETPAERERRLANEAWLRRVPDDPGGLLREKFRIEHERRRRQGGPGGLIP